jgi:hypothetical protein
LAASLVGAWLVLAAQIHLFVLTIRVIIATPKMVELIVLEFVSQHQASSNQQLLEQLACKPTMQPILGLFQ